MKKIVLLLLFMICGITLVFSATVEKLAETRRSWDGALLPKIQTKETKVSVLRISIAAGEKLAMHKHPVVNVGYLLQGELTVYKKDGKKIQIKEGESLVEVVNTWHYGENTGDSEAVIVVVYVGDAKTPITVKKES